MIFHTDNGKEFTAQTVIELVKSHHPGIITVTGHPRTPHDQGSIKNANKQVKAILGQIEQFERDRGVVNPNWIDLLPRVETTMNSRPQKNSGNVSAFKAMFGMKYDFPVSCGHAIVRQCKTLQDLLNLACYPRFDAVAKELDSWSKSDKQAVSLSVASFTNYRGIFVDSSTLCLQQAVTVSVHAVTKYHGASTESSMLVRHKRSLISS